VSVFVATSARQVGLIDGQPVLLEIQEAR